MLIWFSILVEAKSPLLTLVEAKSEMFTYWLSIPMGYYPHYLGMDNLDTDHYRVWIRATPFAAQRHRESFITYRRQYIIVNCNCLINLKLQKAVV